MADKSLEDLDPFNCPICLDAFQDPVTIPCGHNYCMSCIKHYWEKNGSRDAGYTCPECRKTFSPRPALNKNTMFAEVVERFKNTGLQDTSPARYRTPVHIKRQNGTTQNPKPSRILPEMDRTHLRYDSPREKHTVIVVAGEPKENICLRHRTAPGVCSQFCASCFDEAWRQHKAFSAAPQITQTLESRTTLVKHEHRSRDKTTGRDKRTSKKRVHASGHRSGHTRGPRKGRESHRRKSSGHRRDSHEHRHHAGHRKKRLGVMVMTGNGTERTILDKIGL
ncbi:uncharacterized protein si:busm1-163l24.4 [Danio aesculapii]|uniref:uncharacterized protein si:busm1-163l24.4 n=1 Tax=Danio aesculapii TaxID=1142201 RepID=UPI0024C05E40|nr:uncharacterized protein si:busm1-163l24.4 [Danio aesculapii]